MENYLVINETGADYKGAYQKRFKEYLISNASDVLANKIKESKKNLYDCFLYVLNEVKAIYTKANGNVNGGIYMSDEEVFNMVIHYFEEESIPVFTTTAKAPKETKKEVAKPIEATEENSYKVEKATKKPVKEVLKENPKENKGFSQMSLFDLI